MKKINIVLIILYMFGFNAVAKFDFDGDFSIDLDCVSYENEQKNYTNKYGDSHAPSWIEAVREATGLDVNEEVHSAEVEIWYEEDSGLIVERAVDPSSGLFLELSYYLSGDRSRSNS